jgi:hypothetical protein
MDLRFLFAALVAVIGFGASSLVAAEEPKADQLFAKVT